MLKSTDSIGINPVGRITPVLSALAVGDPLQAIDNRTSQFAKGQASPSGALPFLQDVAADLLKNNVTTANVSSAAHLIDNILKQAEATGVSKKFEATAVVTHSPKSPDVIAKDLKAAISNSGLFYESHLGDYVEGFRSLADIKQQPQNQPNSMINNLLPQQLAVLENQRLSWHGEVWPHQKMDWDIYLPQKDRESANGGNHLMADEPKPIASDLTLYLPNLGKVTAKLSLIDGRMRISMFAEEQQTLATLRTQSKSLTDAIQKNGQILERLQILEETVVVQHD